MRAEELSLAIADYTKVIELEPDSPDAYYNRGIVYYQLMDYEAALADFNTIIAAEMPNIVQALNMRAVIFYTQQKVNLALDDLTSAIIRDPEYPDSYERRALVYKAMGKTSQAVADLKRYLELETDPDLLNEAEKQLQALGG